MKTSVAQIGQNKFKLTVEVPAEDLKPYVDRTYRRLAGEIRVPGFRPGKAPRPIIDKRLGKEYVRSETLREALPDLFSEAVKENDLEVVAPPHIDVTSEDDAVDLAFDATVETKPTPELKEYSGLDVKRPDDEVSDSDVEEQIERLQFRFATLEVVERAAQESDFVLVDLTTSQDGEQIEGLTAKDLLVEIGQAMVVEELDTQLPGKSPGDILDLNVELPERFGDRAGQKVDMQVLVKEVKNRKMPELDDKFAADVSEHETIEELRSDLRERMAEVKVSQSDAAVRERTIEAFLEHGVEVDLPEGMIEFEVDSLLEQLVRGLASRGIRIEQYLEYENLDVDALRQRYREQAEKNITLRLGLDEIAAREGLTASEEDRHAEVHALADRVGKDAHEILDAISEGGDWSSVDGDIMRSKALDLLIARAQITKEEAQ